MSRSKSVPATSSGVGGAYSVVVPMLTGVHLVAYYQEVDGADQIVRYGQRFSPSVPGWRYGTRSS